MLARLAQAAEAWPRSPEVGQSLLELFSRSTDAEVQRSILFAAAKTQWPVRQALILAALKTSSGSVLGVALDAAAAHPDASYLPAIGELLAEEPDPRPQLIDAVGAVGDSQAVGQLVAWLDREKNSALRMKLIMAINRIPGETSARVLSDL